MNAKLKLTPLPLRRSANEPQFPPVDGSVSDRSLGVYSCRPCAADDTPECVRRYTFLTAVFRDAWGYPASDTGRQEAVPLYIV